MSVSQTMLEELVVKLVADPGNHEAITQRFLQSVSNSTSMAQNHADEYAKHVQRAHEVTMAVATPIERFGLKVEELDDLMRLGIITQTTYNRSFDALQRELDQTTPKVDRLGNALSKMEKMAGIGYKLSFAFTAPLTLLGGMALKTASDAEESLNKFDVIFGPVLQKASADVDMLDKKFGLTGTSARQMMGSTGDLLKGFGFSADNALKLSTEVQKLSVDVASFSNVEGGAARVSSAMTKAMLGEREMLKEMGIAILEEDVKLEMNKMKKEGVVFATERMAKAQATLNIALDQSAHRLGDFANTEASFANQTRMLHDEFWELVQLFGKEMIPVALELTTNVLRPLVEQLSEMSPAGKQVAIVVMGMAAAAGPAMIGLAGIASAASSLKTAWPTVQAGAGALKGLASNATLARAGLYAVGTYLAYEGLKSLMGYNAAVKDTEHNMRALADTTNLMDTKNTTKDDAKQQSLFGIKDKAKRQEELKAYRADLDRIAHDKAANVLALQKMDDDAQNKGTGASRWGRWYNGMDATLAANITDAQKKYNDAKQRIMQVDAELKETAQKIKDQPKEDAMEQAASFAGVMGNKAAGLFGGFSRVARGGPSSAEKAIVGDAVSTVADFATDALKNRFVNKGVANWLEQVFAEPGKHLGVIQEGVINLRGLVAQPLKLKFESQGLNAVLADSFEFWNMWQKQSTDATKEVKAAQSAVQDNAANAAALGATMVGAGGLGAMMFGAGAGNTAGMKTDAQIEADQKAQTKANRAMAKSSPMSDEQAVLAKAQREADNAAQIEKATQGKVARDAEREQRRIDAQANAVVRAQLAEDRRKEAAEKATIMASEKADRAIKRDELRASRDAAPDKGNSDKEGTAKLQLDALNRIAETAPFVVRVAGGPGW